MQAVDFVEHIDFVIGKCRLRDRLRQKGHRRRRPRITRPISA
jgi:hypothetical protein